jgi:hypothetical protein
MPFIAFAGQIRMVERLSTGEFVDFSQLQALGLDNVGSGLF